MEAVGLKFSRVLTLMVEEEGEGVGVGVDGDKRGGVKIFRGGDRLGVSGYIEGGGVEGVEEIVCNKQIKFTLVG